jgi:hypothetical protein
MLVAMGAFGVFAAALLVTWSGLGRSALNMTAYAERQNDQMRVVDYLRRDIRRASTVEIYEGATLMTGTAWGSELRLTVPDYYVDTREEDLANGARTANTPSLSSGNVTYGATLTVRYTVQGGAVIRTEGGVSRALADAAGAFVISFSREASGEVRSRIVYDQRMQGGGAHTLRRQIEVLCGQRAQLQL